MDSISPDILFVHKPGKDQANADSLSRRTYHSSDLSLTTDPEDIFWPPELKSVSVRPIRTRAQAKSDAQLEHRQHKSDQARKQHPPHIERDLHNTLRNDSNPLSKIASADIQ